MKLIVERDQRTIEQINHLITWSQQHHFWQTVIVSPASLRRNWIQMVAQLKQERRGQVLQPPNRQAAEFVLDLFGFGER